MAKLVTKFKYLKPNGKLDVGGYAKYIATREGVEKIDDTWRLAPATINQRKFIEKLLVDFPDTAQMIEYEDYVKSNTISSASELITRAIEDNAYFVMNTKTYADYIATRPRAERFGSHGLFTDDGVQVQLSKVSEELNQHEGNVWTLIVSLRREDAERLGFNSGARWRDMLRTQTESLATNLKIPMEHLKWFAAFHNESHHPHVHLIAYSDIQNEGFLTKQGVKNIRSSLAKDVFAQDNIALYQKQTEHRDTLRTDSKQLIADIINQINSGEYENPKVEELLQKISVRLKNTTAKKIYGYQKADVKNMIDSVVDELSADGRTAELYDLWYEQKFAILKTYTDTLPDKIPLSKNDEFKNIRNAVIKEAMRLYDGSVTFEDDDIKDEPVDTAPADDAAEPTPEPIEQDTCSGQVF